MARVSIEDCQLQMPNRFALVVVAANRARQLMASSQALIDTKNKEAVTALREIADGKVTFKGSIKKLDATAGDEVEAMLASGEPEAAAETKDAPSETPAEEPAPTSEG